MTCRRRQFALLFLLCLPALRLYGQNGALLPNLPPSFTGTNGQPAANGFLCTTASGTMTPLATFSDSTLQTPLPNPIRLSGAGIPQTNSGASTAVYLQGRNYRITLFATGSSTNRCNGVPVGAQIWQRDNIYDYGQIASIGGVFPPFPPGGNGTVRIICVTTGTLDTAIMAAYAMLGGAGGTIDCTGRQGTQTLAADPFAAMMGPVTVLLPPVGITLMVPINIPNNVLVQYTGGVNIDIQSTVTACTTPAAPGATCTVQVTNNFGAANQETFCNFRDMPSVNIGFPVVLKVANLDLNNVTVTIGTYNGLPAGGGTLVCSTNVAH